MESNWTFLKMKGDRGHIGKLKHNSYDAWINVFEQCFYMNGGDVGMIALNGKLLDYIKEMQIQG